MALRMGHLYDALRQGQGITDDHARLAAEEVAAYEQRIAAVERKLQILTWMVGMNLTLTLLAIGQLFGVFFMLTRLGR